MKQRRNPSERVHAAVSPGGPAPRRPWASLPGLLLSLALLGNAAAQTHSPTSPDLQAYRSMAAALDQAVVDRAGGSAPSLSDLDRATAAYATLKPGLSSSLLAGGIDASLGSARAALSRAPADLEAQVVQVRSLMRKALYDQTLGELGRTGATPALRAQAAELATEFGLQPGDRTRVLNSVTSQGGAAAARLLRSAAARKVQASLAGATVPQNTDQRTATYLALARATGWFTVTQDAPDTGGLKLTEFTQAITQLTGNDNAALGPSLQTLKQGAAAFVKASAQAVTRGSSLPATTPSAGTTGTTTAPVTTPVMPAHSSGTAAVQTLPVQTVPLQSAAAQSTPVQTPAERQQTGLNATYAALARAEAAAGHASLEDARTQLGQASQSLSGSGLSSTAGYDTLVLDLDALQGRSGLRPTEIQAVTAELNNLELRANAHPTSTLDSVSASVTRLGTPLWPLLFLLVGLLAIYPLYLLNLAFGGRNNYWKAIAASLLLLFVPVMLEGLGGTLAYLGDLGGVGFLRALGNLSLHQGAWGLPLWLLLAAGSVGLASYGFRGLCRQFGLLGGSSGSSATPTRIDTAQSSLDWDEEL